MKRRRQRKKAKTPPAPKAEPTLPPALPPKTHLPERGKLPLALAYLLCD